jgi:hypothetical protein
VRPLRGRNLSPTVRAIDATTKTVVTTLVFDDLTARVRPETGLFGGRNATVCDESSLLLRLVILKAVFESEQDGAPIDHFQARALSRAKIDTTTVGVG